MLKSVETWEENRRRIRIALWMRKANAKGNWWWPISISLCRPPKVTSRYQWTGSALLKCPSKFLFHRESNSKNNQKFLSVWSSLGQKFCKFPNQDWTTIFFLLQFQSANNEIPLNRTNISLAVGVTCWIVFHMWIIYIGKGCIYFPFLIKHPQPLRSYLDSASQYTGA